MHVLFLVLEDIDPDKVYVLGGLVDESIHKVCGALPHEQRHPSAVAASTVPFASNSAWSQQQAGRGCSSVGAASPRAGFGSVAAQDTCVRPCVSMSTCPLQELTLRRAREQCLQTARLPIREYMVKAPNARNYHSETLAINQGEGLHGGWRVSQESGEIQRLGVIP